jgi:hypothetical protein
MNRAVILPLLALVTLAAPRTAGASTPTAAVEAAPQDALKLVVPDAFRRAAERTAGLSTYALRDTLDEVAVSSEFWAGFRSIMTELAKSPQAQRQIDEFMRSETGRQVAPPGVPPHVMYRAIAAASAAAELLPSDLLLTAVLEQAAEDFDRIAQGIEARLRDRTTPVALRRMERRAIRGMAAAMLLGALENTIDPKRCTELLGIYAEGMETAICLIAVGLEGEAAAKADGIIRDLRLDPPDRAALRWRAEQLAEAEETLAATADHLDGEPLRLPPDPAFRPSDS